LSREYVANRADENGVSRSPEVWVGLGIAYELNTLCDLTVSADLTFVTFVTARPEVHYASIPDASLWSELRVLTSFATCSLRLIFLGRLNQI
jgi:hypothetical protein